MPSKLLFSSLKSKAVRNPSRNHETRKKAMKKKDNKEQELENKGGWEIGGRGRDRWRELKHLFFFWFQMLTLFLILRVFLTINIKLKVFFYEIKQVCQICSIIKHIY